MQKIENKNFSIAHERVEFSLRSKIKDLPFYNLKKYNDILFLKKSLCIL